MTVERTDIAEHMRRGNRQIDGELRCDVPVGKSANTVGAEESAHADL
jgi:hypothetical protein